jgi:hypothetical protein
MWNGMSGVHETEIKDQNKSTIMIVSKLKTYVQYIRNKNEIQIFLNVSKMSNNSQMTKQIKIL